MIKNLNEILKEWAYRVDDGQPNPKKSAHLYHLSETLIENKWPFEVIEELLQNLTEVDIIKNKKSGNVYSVQTHNPDTQDLVKKDASEDDIEKIKDKKRDFTSKSEPTDDLFTTKEEGYKKITTKSGKTYTVRQLKDENGEPIDTSIQEGREKAISIVRGDRKSVV